MKFIFWNIHKQLLVEEIAELIAEKQCDIGAFAEANEETIKQAVELLKEKYFHILNLCHQFFNLYHK